ncbi:hypothetical protein BJ878DRAFT_534452 [Calycina marina]|uniref:Zn(2)-C6 fungal-type domain-containing protein n=1 Tax=Calycina marina TaxID=1763456 RepID=A0A9P8CEZ6_9HELO|nr:hypothetical protein BJ878DRAFT_534452 [Calycina marina]
MTVICGAAPIARLSRCEPSLAGSRTNLASTEFQVIAWDRAMMNSSRESSSLFSSGPSSKQRRERGGIAAQACDTCRTRKQKCDEQRPKCSLCQRMKLECRYREPQPTKKDKTMVEILDRLIALEGKVDRIVPGTSGNLSSGFGPAHSTTEDVNDQPSFTTQTSYRPLSSISTAKSSAVLSTQPYRYVSAALILLTWAKIQQLLLQTVPSSLADVKIFEQQGVTFMVRVHRSMPTFVGMQPQSARTSGGSKMTIQNLTKTHMLDLTKSYFDTFNLVYPFMDRQDFTSETLARVQTEGFGGDSKSPVEIHGDRASGIRSGSTEKPPGLAFFNEARKRLGFQSSQCDLEVVQILSLTADPVDWTSKRGDMIKCIFWHCAIMETSIYLELDLPPVGIIKFAEQIGLPHFTGAFCDEDHQGNTSSPFEAHFPSQVALRRLSTQTSGSTDGSRTIPSHKSLKLLAAQLREWRSILPSKLHWAEDQREAFPIPQVPNIATFNERVDPDLLSQTGRDNKSLFTADLSAPYMDYPYVYDIQVALLRTSYYYEKYMICRPYVYKALHNPVQIEDEDAQGVAECLRRMVPYLFCWSQNFLTILIIVHMTEHNEMLRNIRRQLAGPRFEAEIGATVETMIDWIRDLKNSDPISPWCWNILTGIYQLEP